MTQLIQRISETPYQGSVLMLIGVSEVICNCVLRAAERQLSPWDLRRGKNLHVQRFILCLQVAADHMRGIGDNDDRRVLVGIDIEQSVDLDIEVDLFSGLADRRLLDPFAEIDEASWEYPLAIGGLNCTLDEDETAIERE